jgi:transposase-like protein
MKTVPKYSPKFRERAVRLVFDHQGEHKTQWAAIVSIASKIGCTSETLRKWVRQAERDQGQRDRLSFAKTCSPSISIIYETGCNVVTRRYMRVWRDAFRQDELLAKDRLG